MKIIHLLIIFVLITLIAACDQPISHAQSKSQEESAKCYDIVFSPQARADTFLIDKCEGKVWRLTQFTDLEGDPSAWYEMPIISQTGQKGISLSDFLQSHQAKKQ
jgi:hypothetical protein